MDKVSPCLWFDGKALEAAELYTSLVPGSRIVDVHRGRTDTPATKAGDVLLVKFELAGRTFLGLNGGPHTTFNDAVSMSIDCEDQAEVDRLWDKLTADGGKPIQCGWLHDRYGLRWQIVPKRLPELLAHPDPAVGSRVMRAMMEMVKLDVAKLEAAAMAA